MAAKVVPRSVRLARSNPEDATVTVAKKEVGAIASHMTQQDIAGEENGFQSDHGMCRTEETLL